MIAQKPSISKLTAQPGAGAAGAAEGPGEGLTLQEIRLGAAASAPWKPAGGLSPEGADSQGGGQLEPAAP